MMEVGQQAGYKKEGADGERERITHTHTLLRRPLVPATITVGGPWPLDSLRMVKANPTGMLQECES